MDPRMKPLIVGMVLAIVLPMVSIYCSDWLSLDIRTCALWPLLGGPLLGGAMITLADLFCKLWHGSEVSQESHHG